MPPTPSTPSLPPTPSTPSTRAQAAPIRLRAPLDLLGAMPHLLGFVPRSSLVVMCLDDANRTRLTARADLPEHADITSFADDMATHVVRSGAASVALVVYTDEPATPSDVHTVTTTAVHPLARRVLVDQLASRLRRDGCGLSVAMLVSKGRYFNYLCDEPCCRAEGEPVPDQLTSAAAQLAAETVLDGRVVHSDRSSLADRVAGSPLDASRAALFERTDFELTTSWFSDGMRAGRVTTTALMAHAVLARLRTLEPEEQTVAAYAGRWGGAVRPAGLLGPAGLSPEGVARLVLGLHDKRARDTVATHALDVPPVVLVDVLCELARATPDRFAAPVCTLVAWVSYLVGDGALANVALERAFACCPDYEMAHLLESGLRHQIGPAAVREVLVGTRRDLEAADERETAQQPRRPHRGAAKDRRR